MSYKIIVSRYNENIDWLSPEMNNCIIRNNNLGININTGSYNGTLVKNTLFENNVIAYNYANNGLIDSCIFIGNTEAVTPVIPLPFPVKEPLNEPLNEPLPVEANEALIA